MTEFSYKNIYGSKKYNEFIERQHYAIDDKFVCNTMNCELSDGFSVEFVNYSDKEHKDKKAVASKIILKNAKKKYMNIIVFTVTALYIQRLFTIKMVTDIIRFMLIGTE